MENLKKLFIKKGDQLTHVETQNYLLDQSHQAIKELSKFYFSLPLEELNKRQQAMTNAHCYHEMNFQIKDQSGQYSKVVATPFHGFAPIEKQYLDETVSSTKDLLSATRKLLQNLFSNKEISKESLGIDSLPEQEANELIQIIRENIYYEPELTHKSLSEYPFLAVVGFDCAVADLTSPHNIFFEFNAGTPCGIEDQYQLFEHAKEIFPEVLDILDKYITPDQSHALLKQTIDECAISWTGKKEGISVILSPGPYNPAHPEIAAIAKRSGMPLVKIQDLYIDENGYVRLHTINEEHPIVTGIYNRKEESFLIYSEKYQIPLRSPFTSQNQQLSKQYDIELKEGILYSYTYDESFNITGVDIDAGKAKYQTLFEQISVAPKTGKKGDIVQALWEKKLYISNLGGRVFDDKRAFRIISEHLVKSQNKARPPGAISLDQLVERIDEAVIKAPDLSGGAGVIIGAQLSPAEKEIEIEKVKNTPHYYELQELAKLAVINSYSKEEKKLIPLPIDWRLIISFGPDEIPRISTHSCLVRTAPFGSLKTNTSAGGGYALGFILNNEEIDSHPSKNEFKQYPLTITRHQDLIQFDQEVQRIIDEEDRSQLENLTYKLRDIMDLIGLNNITWINTIRELMDNNISFTDFDKSYQQFLKDTKLKDLIVG